MKPDPVNDRPGRCPYCNQWVGIGQGVMRSVINNRVHREEMIIFHNGPCPEVSSGLGIGGTGSDDYNIHTETDRGGQPAKPAAGTHYAPAGTTDGVRTPGKRCEHPGCWREADWNPGAGQYLCARHWDEY